MGAALPGSGADARVPQAALLVEFAESLLRGEAVRQRAARETLARALGAAALVDAAAIVASFNAVVKIADGTGIPLEAAKAAATEDLRAALGLEQFNKNVAAD
ncbi:MAG: hypothetical protein AMJ64_13840 [Betaproteobacteria bacterium SG8_39]|nr:MAG: hypothetical protein AMJ64_13840 [Betaproteobacteria bacterium SG8_39]